MVRGARRCTAPTRTPSQGVDQRRQVGARVVQGRLAGQSGAEGARVEVVRDAVAVHAPAARRAEHADRLGRGEARAEERVAQGGRLTSASQNLVSQMPTWCDDTNERVVRRRQPPLELGEHGADRGSSGFTPVMSASDSRMRP
jgi:hypothetical protein